MGNIDTAIGRIATGQAGAISWAQLIGAGVNDVALRRALRTGRLHQVDLGVFVANGAPGTRWQEWWIAHLRAGASSVLSHWTAGLHYGFDGVRRGPPVLTIPHRRGSPPAGIVVHRSRRLDPIDTCHAAGLPFTTPARTVMDLAAECGEARLGMIADSAHFSGQARYEAIGAVLLRIGGRGRRGSGRLARVLDERCGDALSASRLEHLLADLVRAAGLRLGIDAVRQHPLPSHGAVVGTVDVFVPLAAVIVEADGRRWHERQTAMKRDRERDFAAAQVGVQTVRLMHEHLHSDLAGCAAGLRRVIEARTAELGRITTAGVG